MRNFHRRNIGNYWSGGWTIRPAESWLAALHQSLNMPSVTCLCAFPPGIPRTIIGIVPFGGKTEMNSVSPTLVLSAEGASQQGRSSQKCISRLPCIAFMHCCKKVHPWIGWLWYMENLGGLQPKMEKMKTSSMLSVSVCSFEITN